MTAALCILLWVVFQPDVPAAANQSASQPERGYQAGGAKCTSEALRSVPDRVARQAKADDCAQKSEEHRAQQADLVQQTRAANGSETVAALTEDQTRLALLTTMLSLVATSLLIWTFWDTRSTNRAQLRAYLGMNATGCTPRGAIASGRHLAAQMKNFGPTPALNVKIVITPSTVNGEPVRPGESATFASLPPTQFATPTLEVPAEDVARGLAGETIYWQLSWQYDDVFGRRHSESMLLSTEPPQWAKGFVGPVVRETRGA
ncbi:MAG: hypothetical protein Q7J13_02775 [Brevundimonas sp.]|uniref:hypothetical protein n=1 Tax=Brevundimonas sp. TaxID=1871086 RepID=UPI00271EAF88|nr:hypothetical protein [Brevundimonas sp.]MDO9586834.1 hypothetical protein [Brevundimonas sp.]